MRANIDDTFTAEDAQLRLARAAFAGFFGGAGLSGVGATVALPRQARGMLEARQQAFADAALSVEETGAGFSDRPTAESSKDINVQVNAALDPARGKPAAFIPETSGTPTNLGIDEDNKTVEVDKDGSTYFAARVPGKGTIISGNKSGIVDAVVESGASDAVLAEALGYSAPVPDAVDRVVRVKDADGNVISEEATNVDGQEAAELAAARIAGKTDTVDVVDVETALKERKGRKDEERSREMVNEEDPDFTEEDVARSAEFTIVEEDAGLPVEEQVTVFAADILKKEIQITMTGFKDFRQCFPKKG